VPNRTRRAVVPSAGIAALVLGIGVALAGTITGTPKNDVLRGTSGRDVLLGKAGNDKLYGLAGNDRLLGGPGKDRLVGGPGADVLNCGGGVDTAVADARDTVTGNCERGRPSPPPQPRAQPGRFVGTTSQGRPFSFAVNSTGFSVAGLRFDYGADCTPAGQYTQTGAIAGGDAHIQITPDRRFTVSEGPFVAGSFGELTISTAITGVFDASGTNASGTVQVHVDIALGPPRSCDTGSLTWSATKQ
jgi:hypothetical protein